MLKAMLVPWTFTSRKNLTTTRYLCVRRSSMQRLRLWMVMFTTPVVCVPDLVVRNADGTIDIIDTKFVGSYTDHENEDYIKIIQAMFLFHVLLRTM